MTDRSELCPRIIVKWRSAVVFGRQDAEAVKQ
jgi:hypothetical protein